jgi:hypothetical protein
MTGKSLIRWTFSLYLVPLLALLALLGWLAASGQTSALQNPRVWVQYKPGRKAAVREALTQMGAIFNYDFGDLNAFVVSLPEGALQQVARHPDVADHWFAQASAKNHS